LPRKNLDSIVGEAGALVKRNHDTVRALDFFGEHAQRFQMFFRYGSGRFYFDGHLLADDEINLVPIAVSPETQWTNVVCAVDPGAKFTFFNIMRNRVSIFVTNLDLLALFLFGVPVGRTFGRFYGDSHLFAIDI
jgi:hypothetical protein